jgi:hypothetical protein
MRLRTSTPPPPASNDVLHGRDPSCLARTIEDRLRRSGYLALREVACDTRGGIVRLRGCLPTYYLKQVAQETVAEVHDVRRIINRIIVSANGESLIGSGHATGTRKRPFDAEVSLPS